MLQELYPYMLFRVLIQKTCRNLHGQKKEYTKKDRKLCGCRSTLAFECFLDLRLQLLEFALQHLFLFL